MRFSSTLLRLAALAVVAHAAWLPAQSFDLDHGREPVVSLDGPWRFHPGDSPQSSATEPDGRTAKLWAAPGFDDSAWPLLDSGESWAAQGYPGMSGFGWYRFAVKVPAGEKPTALLLAPIMTSFEVYVDGRLAGGSGEMLAQLPDTRISYQQFPLTAGGSASARVVQVAIRVWHAPIWASYVGGGPYRPGHLAGDP